MYTDNNEIENNQEEENKINGINNIDDNINNINNNINNINNINNNINNINNINIINNEEKEVIKEDNNNIKRIFKIPNDMPENVASIILDKIFSDIIINKKIKDIYANIPDHCYKFINKLISSYLNNHFLFHENGIDNLSYQQNILFYDKEPIKKVNNWTIVNEPTTPEADRHITGKTRVIKLSKKEEINYINNEKKDEIENNSVNINEVSNNQNNSQDEKEENNLLKEKKEESYKNIIVKKRKKYKLKKTFGEIVREKELKYKENSKKKNNNNKKEKKENEDSDDNSIVLEMTSHDLKNIDKTYKIYNDNEESNLLRKERELLLIQKEKDRVKEEIRKKKEKEKMRKLLLQGKKNFKSDILTFDSNGKIIKKKLYLEDIKKDLPKPKLKIVESGSDVNNVPIKRRSIMQIKENKQNKIINNKKQKNEIVIFNPNDKKSFIFENPKLKSNKEIEISGNNFELVKPEVGVVISNESKNQKKEGGFDYLKKYNKPSMNDYSKLSQNSINSLSSYMYEINYKINNYNNNDEQNYIGYKEEFNENNNPLFQGGYKIPSLNSTKNNFKEGDINDINNLNSLKNKKKLKKLVYSYDNIKMNNNRYKGYNSIVLNDDVKSENLKDIFNTNENEEFDTNKRFKSIGNNSYLGRSRLYSNRNRSLKRRRELPIITESNGKKDVLNEFINVNDINKFNFRIIKDKNWGDNIYSNQNHRNKNLVKSQDYLHTDANINIFRKNNSNNKYKESGSNMIINLRKREKINNMSILPKILVK